MKRLALLAALLATPGAAFAQASPSAYTSAIRYDAVGQVTGTISADPDALGSGLPFLAVRNSYDGAGRLIKVETGTLATWQSESVAPASWGSAFTVSRALETQYDALGHKLRDTLREGASGTIRTVTQYSYDSVGRLECTAVRMNPAVFGSLPTSACTLGTEGSDGPDRTTKMVYDAAGERLQLREGVGTAIEATEATWAYNDDGQVVTVLDGNGNRASLHYDGFGRQDSWIFPSTTAPSGYSDATQTSALASAGSVNASDHEDYSYDPNGNRTDLRKRDGRHIVYAYDALNRVTSKIYPQGGATPVYYGYDNRNLQTFVRFDSASGAGVTNSFDGFGRLASASADVGGTTRTLTYGYDRDGNRTSLVHPDGTAFASYFDNLDRLVMTMSGASAYIYTVFRPDGARQAFGTPAASVGYDYDGVGRRSAMMDDFAGSSADAGWTYARDAAGGLRSVTRDNDSYAWAGHYTVNRGYTTNGLNQYSAAGGASFSYDANGNLTSDGTTTYGYDIENRLISASGGHSATLSYDPLGRLAQVTSGSSTTRFLYDGDALVAEYNGSNALTARHLHAAGADVPMVTFAGTSLASPHFLYADHEGSIIAAADGSGNRIAVDTYDEYGIPGSANTGRFQYTGQAWLAELGLYFYKARFYTPTLGRFMQTDPVGYQDQSNLYAYVGDDPINRVDPAGTNAIVLIHEDGRIGIVLPMTFTGDAASPRNIEAAERDIESTWTGDFGGLRVTTTVVQGSSPLDPNVHNEEVLTSGNTSRMASDGTQGHSFVNQGRSGEITMRDVHETPIVQPRGDPTRGEKGRHTYAHEGGHHMGAPDRAERGSLMGRGDSSRVTRQDIQDVMQHHTRSGATNTIIKCAEDDRC